MVVLIAGFQSFVQRDLWTMTISLPLTRGCFTLIDDEDFGIVSPYKWRASGPHNNRGLMYAVSGDYGGPYGTIWLHRVVTNCPNGLEPDHLNGDGLDNRKENLRVVTHAKNIARAKEIEPIRSSTGYRGVFPHPKAATFEAKIGKVNLGWFRSAETAARAYDAAAIKKYGRTSDGLNFPNEISATPPKEDNRLGDIPYRGISRSGKKFRARITINGKEVYIGVFYSIEEAIEARRLFSAKSPS